MFLKSWLLRLRIFRHKVFLSHRSWPEWTVGVFERVEVMKALRYLVPVLAAFCITPAAYSQQNYPTKPIKVFVGYSPGGAVDVVARTVGQKLSTSLGQAVIVENKPGAGTNIAVRALIDSAPDGYTLMVSANALAANPSLYQPAPFDPERDVAPIAQIGRVPVVIATSANSELTTIDKLIAAAKANPGKVNFASPGNGQRHIWQWNSSHAQLASVCNTSPIAEARQPSLM